MKASKHASKTAPTSEAMVVEIKQNPLNLHTPQRKRRAVVASTVILAVIIAVTAAILVARHQANSVLAVCGDSIAEQANSDNQTGAISSFGLLVGQIQGKPNYTRDPNCMYILAEYQMTSGKITAAKATVSQLQTKHAKFVFNSHLDSGKASVANLKKQLAIMENAQDNANGRSDPNI